MNVYIMYKLIQQLRMLIAVYVEEEQEFRIKGAGCLFWVLRRLFRIVDRYVAKVEWDFLGEGRGGRKKGWSLWDGEWVWLTLGVG